MAIDAAVMSGVPDGSADIAPRVDSGQAGGEGGG